MDGGGVDPGTAAEPVSIAGRRRKVLAGLVPLFYVVFAGYQLWRGDPVPAGVALVAAVVLTVVVVRPPTVVDPTGISRPWRWRRRFIPWSEVDAIIVPPTGLEPPTPPRVALVGGGRPVVLGDIAPGQAALVARIGNRPVRHPPMPGTIAPPAREKVPSDSDVEADVARRAAALEQRWVDLDTQNRHRPRRSD